MTIRRALPFAVAALLAGVLAVGGMAAAQTPEADPAAQAAAAPEPEPPLAVPPPTPSPAASGLSETTRLVAAERARLTEVAQAQAEFRQDLAARAAASLSDGEAALAWRRQVRDLRARSLLDPDRAVDADRLYGQLVEALRTVRADLWGELSAGVRRASPPPAPPQLDPALAAAGDAAAPLRAERQRLILAAQTLGGVQAETAWDRATSLREAMIVMNDARLDLIPVLSRGYRASLLGFGDVGLAQARREAAQIGLEFQYNALRIPRFVREMANVARASAAPALLMAVQVLLAGLAFRMWRRHGGALLSFGRQHALDRRPQTLTAALAATVLDHLDAIRRPLDWLLLFVILRALVPENLRFPGAEYFWMIVVWFLVAAIGFQLSDSLMRRRGVADPRAVLRRRSLRLVAGTGAGVGLVLSLAHNIVGAGAIYSWALQAVWLLVLPVAALLIHWWRDRIDTLAKAGADRNALLAWSAQGHQGPLRFVARVLATAVLVTLGARTIAARRINDVALLRDIFDQRRRLRSAEALAADQSSGRYALLPEDQLVSLGPHREPLDMSRNMGPPHLDIVITPGEILAIVGNRGLGKSTVLARFAEDWPDGHVLSVRGATCVADALASLGQALGVEPNAARIAAALAKGKPALVCVDDVDSLARPVIGGLDDLDQLIAFARTTGPGTTWAIAVGDLAWEYIERARDNRALLDRVVRLRPWSDDAVSSLILRRTRQAGLDPHFEDLQLPASSRLMSDLSREDRARVGFFELLTDYANGNPAVALELWRRSLRIDTTTGDVVVRMFPTPPVEALAALPVSVFFVLRALLRLDRADEASLADASNQSRAVVADALRRLIAIGAVEPVGQGFRVRLFWRRESTKALERLNMLTRRMA